MEFIKVIAIVAIANNHLAVADSRTWINFGTIYAKS